MDMKDWGKIHVSKVEEGDDFATLYRELQDCESNLPIYKGFRHNLGAFVNGIVKGELFTLVVDETDKMFEHQNPMFVEGMHCTLPCLMLMDKDKKCYILWVHKRARGNGFGRLLAANVKYAATKLPGSEGFWEKCGL